MNLECAVVEFNVEGLEGLVLNIKFSKTDQFRGGGGGVISCCKDEVKYLLSGNDRALLFNGSHEKVFRAIVHTRSNRLKFMQDWGVHGYKRKSNASSNSFTTTLLGHTVQSC